MNMKGIQDSSSAEKKIYIYLGLRVQHKQNLGLPRCAHKKEKVKKKKK